MPPVSESLSPEWIAQVLALSDPVQRNREITRTYWLLAAALTRHFEPNATWLSFAVWASSSAGELLKDGPLAAIADEPEERAAVSFFQRALDFVGLGAWLDGVTRSVVDHTADGNRLVFAEAAPFFIELGDKLSRGRLTDTEIRQLFPTAAPGLQAALRRYAVAAGEKNARVRAELILLANLEVVLHEQQRLDGSIRAALHAVVLKGVLPLTRHWLIPLPESVRSCLERLVARVETDAFLTLRIRGEKFELAEDLAARFPADLVQLQNLELLAFLEEWDRTKGTGRGSGAENWAELRDRMDYICCLFRSRQQDSQLFASPFGRAP